LTVLAANQATNLEENPPSTEQILEAGEAFLFWWNSIDTGMIALAFMFVIAVYLTRRWLARGIVKLGNAIFRRISGTLSDEVCDRLSEAIEVLLVTLALYLTLDTLDAPPVLNGLLLKLITSVAVLAVFSAWYRLAEAFVSVLFKQKTGPVVRVEQDWIVRTTRFAIVLFGLTSLLKIWNIDISGALTGVGVLGAGFAIAAQDLVRNLIAGMTNQTEDRFETGDAIEVPGMFMGVVARVDLRSTLIMGFDQIPRHVPNSELANAVLMNFTRMKHRRIWIEFGVVLGTSQEQVNAIKDGLQTFLKESGLFELGSAAPKYTYAHKITDHSIEMLFVAFTKRGGYEDYLIASEAANLKIIELVAEAGTELAYPTQTLDVPGYPGNQSPSVV
jgi:MscS family membrane protein